MTTRVPAELAELAVPVAELRPYGRNPRRGDVGAIRESLQVHGQYRPLVVNRRTSEVLAGNHTLQAARELGWDQIAVTYVDVDDDQAARIVLVDNRTNDLAGYDDGALAELLEQLPDLAGTGFDADALDRLLAQTETDRDTEPREPPAEPTTSLGDVWLLGEHRLTCGDARDQMALDEPVEMILTDPPYGVDLASVTGHRGGVDHGDMAGDTLDAGMVGDLVRRALEVGHELTAPGGAIYVCHPETNGLVFRHALQDAGWDLRQTLIWVKNQIVIGRQDYQWRHEPILYGWKAGAAHRWHGGFSEPTVLDEADIRRMNRAQLLELVLEQRRSEATTILEEDRPHRSDMHPTAKPVALMQRLVRNSSRVGELVYDPFAGSGSTLIACENAARRAVLVELEPGYCDVIVDRWQRHTGREAERAEV